MFGAKLSVMINVAEVVAILPDSSVTVKMTVSLPVPPQRSLSPVELFVQVIF